MSEESFKIRDLKEMLKETEKNFGENEAYKLKVKKESNNVSNKDNEYKVYTYKEVIKMINALGTALISLGLKGKRIAVIGENRFEWEIAYLSIVCGTGVVVPLDKSLPENELKSLIQRSNVDAIFYSNKYEDRLKRIIESKEANLKYLINMDLEKINDGVYSEYELIEDGMKLLKEGNREFLNSKINPEEMNIMLFTSGTTSASKVVALSHKNIVSNLIDLKEILNVTQNDRFLSFLPLHHVFEATVGFLLPIYSGARISFADSIRDIEKNLKEYKVTFAAFVPAIYENFYKTIIRRLDKKGLASDYLQKSSMYKEKTWEEKQNAFKEVYETFGGYSRMFITGAAPISKEVHENLRNMGINVCQGYGLTETSPVDAIETDSIHKVGSIGKALPSVSLKIDNKNEDGIGELLVKGSNVMLGYFENEEANKEVFTEDGWFRTGDLAYIDEDGFVFIKGRKKSVIVLKNGKNIFPEEMENLVNRIDGIKESFVFGKSNTKDKEDIKVFAKVVYDKKVFSTVYNLDSDKDIYNMINKKIKEINKTMPAYKSIRGIVLTEEELIKTASGKIKRHEEIKTIV